MATTWNIQNTLAWTGPFINYQPLLIGGPEPALSIANIVLQTMLGAPFCWRWNRATAAITCVSTQQDYQISVPDFGFVEKAWCKTPVGATTQDLKEMEVKISLSASIEAGRPRFLSSLLDDGLGNITFRTQPVANQAFAVNVMYQKKAPLITSIASTWSPVPDEMSYIFNYGFLALACVLVGDSRFPIFTQKFTAHLLGAQDGLDDMQRNIFMGNWSTVAKELERNSLKTNQGIAGRQA